MSIDQKRPFRNLQSTASLTACVALAAAGALAGCSGDDSEWNIGQQTQAAVTDGLVIAEIYGGGSNTGATYSSKYVVLFNRSAVTIPLDGVVLQYGAAGSAFNTNVNNYFALPNAMLPAGKYFLIKLAPAAPTTGTAVTGEDAVHMNINPAVTNGKFAIALAPLTCGTATTRCEPSSYIDLVGYGNAVDYQGSGPATGPTDNAKSMMRNNGGCADTRDNKADFSVGTPGALRSMATPAHDCGSIPDDAGTDGPVGPVPDHGQVVIAEVYGGAGANGKFQNDYVVLFNRSSEPAELGGLALQYAPSTSDFTNSGNNNNLLPAATLAPGKFFLISMASGAGGDPLPTPDFVDPKTTKTNLALDKGKVALTKASAMLNACGSATNQCPMTDVIDLVGYGTGTTQFEGSGPTANASATNAAIRKNNGCVDTHDNASDFQVGAPTPRNSATPADYCVPIEAGDGGDADTGDPPPPLPEPGEVVIAEVFGGSGSGAPYEQDYVVLFNRSEEPKELGGLALQYASSGSDFNGAATNTGNNLLPSFTLGVGEYYLVALVNGGGASPLPTPDLAGKATNLAAQTGKIALTKASALLAGCGSDTKQCELDSIIDLVGYGTSASQFEGSGPTGNTSSTKAAIRLRGGCEDTDDNAADFVLGAPTPRNNATEPVDCWPPPPPDGGTGGDSGTGGDGGSGGTPGTGGDGGTGGTGGSGGDGGSGGTGAVGGSGGTGAEAGSGGEQQAGSGGEGPGAAGDGGDGVAGGGITGSDDEDDSGCGCSVPGSASGSGGFLLALGMLAVAARRRRR